MDYFLFALKYPSYLPLQADTCIDWLTKIFMWLLMKNSIRTFNYWDDFRLEIYLIHSPVNVPF